jgi:hypothetical protein
MFSTIGFNIWNQIQSKILLIIAMFKPNETKKTQINTFNTFCAIGNVLSSNQINPLKES